MLVRYNYYAELQMSQLGSLATLLSFNSIYPFNSISMQYVLSMSETIYFLLFSLVVFNRKIHFENINA